MLRTPSLAKGGGYQMTRQSPASTTTPDRIADLSVASGGITQIKRVQGPSLKDRALPPDAFFCRPCPLTWQTS